MSSLFIGVVAHHSRLDMALELAKSIKADCVYVDDGTLGEIVNHKRAWSDAVESGKTWALIVQDDAVPTVSNIRQIVLGLVRDYPDRLMSLYLGTGKPVELQPKIERALHKYPNHYCFSYWQLFTGVAVLAPAARIRNFIDWAPVSPYYDIELALYWKENYDSDVLYISPSPFDHDDSASIVAHQVGRPVQPARKAWRTGDITGGYPGIIPLL